MSELTLQQRLHNAFGSQAVENIKSRHAYLHAASHSFEEWDQLWSRSDDITWAHGFGRMVGWDEVWLNSVLNYDSDVIGLYLRLLEMYPEVNGKDPRACGLGGLHTLASGVVEVAQDGLSARTFYETPGSMASTHSPSGKRAGNMLWERYGSDFIYQDGKWLYFHEHVCPDFGFSYDTTDWAHNQYHAGGPGGPGGGPGGPGGGPGGPGGGSGGPGGGPGGPGGGPGGPGGGPGGPGGGPGGPGGGPGGPGGGPGGSAGAKPAQRPQKKATVCTDPGPLHVSWSLTQVVQNSIRWPVPYETLNEENTYSPGRNDPLKNLERNKQKYMG
ncbi:MAG: hypothetical protein PUC06_09945 [Oscillospiraceae bacterium]|nr:hypothetical protein [Oscillospiraceae bacterium]